ncbi:MAG: glycoside hydrolase family 43 protein [Bacteroidota bacterium]
MLKKLVNRCLLLLKMICFILFITLYSQGKAQEVEFFKPGEIWPDNNGVHINAHGGGIIYYKDKYYWFGEHKIAGNSGKSAQVGVSCYSSKDLYNWKDEGIALKVIENDPGNEIEKGCTLERPKVIFNKKTGKFIMWFHLELKGKGYDAARSAVAVSDNIEGPYRYLKSFRPNARYWPVNVKPCHLKPVADSIKNSYCGGKGCLPAHPDTLNLLGRDFINGQMARDMNLFVDDDGSAYHIYSSEENSTLHISKLTDDYLSYSGKYIRLFADRYMEGAALFKYNGKYYIIASDCTGWDPNAARSAVADSVFAQWTEMKNPCIGQDSALTFYSQSTFVLTVQGKKDALIFIGDRWAPKNPIDGRYVWLPLFFENDRPVLKWLDKWSLNIF